MSKRMARTIAGMWTAALFLTWGQVTPATAEIFPSVPPYITGDREVGSTLFCAAGTWPGWVTTSYSWARTSNDGISGENIQPTGPGSQSYLTKPSDANTFIHCNEAAFTAGGDYGFWSSSPVFIRPPAPAGKLRKVPGTR